MQPTNHAPSLAALALFGCLAACHRDPGPPPGTFVIRQVGSRLGDTADDLGVLVVGQSVCGTHVALHSEGGTLAVAGGARGPDACVRLPLHGPIQTLELLVFPGETAALLHGQLLIEPGTCAALPDACQSLCPPELDDDDDDDDAGEPPFVAAACPSDARIVDQATLLVLAVLPEPVAGTTAADTGTGATTGGTTGGTDTGDTTGGTDTGDTTGASTTTGTSTNP